MNHHDSREVAKECEAEQEGVRRVTETTRQMRGLWERLQRALGKSSKKKGDLVQDTRPPENPRSGT